MMFQPHRKAAWCAIALLALTPFGASAAEDSAGKSAADAAQEAPQPKFVWGLLLNWALKYAMSAFTDWLVTKLTTDLKPLPVLERLLFNSKQATIVPLASVSPLGAKSAGALENAVLGAPTKPLTVEDGKENYQAVHVAIVSFDRTGKVNGLKPVSAGFSTGERFRLKVLPTFDGILVIENITPGGKRVQIFPPDGGSVVAVKRGMEILVPMMDDYYFEFTGPSGDEQLVVTIRDPRAFGAAASTIAASRKDDQYGSSFVQETPPGTYPVISQALKLKHGN